MKITDETFENGLVRRRFELAAEDQTVPGLYWRPADADGPRPTILVGHGGFQSKEAPNIVEMAAQFARNHGWATIALDAPGHGERRTGEQIREQEATLRRLREGGVDSPARQRRDRIVRDSTSEAVDKPREPRMVREWKCLLDRVAPDMAGSSYGYWGVSMGCRFGIPLLATEPRIKAAVLGLYGLTPDPVFKSMVNSIKLPLLFLFQYHDELMTPEAGLQLWEAFGSREKTMHINPGPHVGIPKFERDASAAFYVRHLF
jgi:dienelactone hydrolase